MNIIRVNSCNSWRK